MIVILHRSQVLQLRTIFLYPKPADLIFEMPKPADQIFFRGKARFLNKYLKAPIKHIILFTSHIFPQQTNYIFNPSFIYPYLKVEQSLHFYGENCKACRLFFKGAEACRLLFLGGRRPQKFRLVCPLQVTGKIDIHRY